MQQGESQVIVKYERQSADRGFGPDGDLVVIDHRQDETVSIFVERGLTERLTLQAKAGLTRGHDRFVRYDGRGPVELGLRYAVFKGERTMAAVYVGATEAGAGRNAGYASPGKGGADAEVRILLGRSVAVRRAELFADLQLARLRRPDLADENRLDATLGLRPNQSWLFMTQIYAGETVSRPVRSGWIKTETSVVRSFGAWSLQAGWRQTLTGREVAKDAGAIVGFWREF
jgi:hypothetical protein